MEKYIHRPCQFSFLAVLDSKDRSLTVQGGGEENKKMGAKVVPS
jgi:hypothetical protein